MDKLSKDFSSWNIRLYHLSLLLLLASIPLSKYTTSLFQFLVLGLWLLYKSDIRYLETYFSGNRFRPSRILLLVRGFFVSLTFSLLAKFKEYFRNKAALAVTSLLLLHVIGLLYTTDFHYALKDLRTKLPLLLLPLFLSTGPRVDTRTLYWILIGFSAAILGGTLYRLALYINLPVADPRALDPHISHIRFSLNAVFSIFILFYFIRLRNYFSDWQKVLFGIIAVWFIFFMIYLRYTTGISILILVTVLVLVYAAVKGSQLKIRLLLLSFGIALLIVPVIYFVSVAQEFRRTDPVSFAKLDPHTLQGNSYYHDTVNFRVENRKYVGLYICDKELRKSWSLRSSMPIDSLDQKQQVLRFTLIRYLASKELRKDSAGVAQLTPQDIRKIEAGLTNANSRNGFNLRTQINNFLIGWDNYQHHQNPNSSSLIQRFEYWRTSLLLIRQHPVIGVGTGDVPEAFTVQYENMNSSLDPQYRLRSHNQFLSMTVAFGIPGLFWFLFVLIYPMIKTKGYHDYFYIIFWIIFIISIFTEDTIESQEGVTFFAFFTSLFLFAWEKDEVIDLH